LHTTRPEVRGDDHSTRHRQPQPNTLRKRCLFDRVNAFQRVRLPDGRPL
jgi:hypothetical protein